MKVTQKVNWYPNAKQNIKTSCNKISYAVARQTLDKSFVHIPKDTGKMRQTSMGAGVRGSKNNYYIGSYTSYAMKVWNYPNNTRWSTPNTFGKWYERVWKRDSTNIISNCSRRYGIK